MTKKTTKRAFMLSLLSLLMCCTMLLGTTFAWFTDTVTSTGNRIVAGTLEVDLLKYVDNGYVSVADETGRDIFDGANGVNWEPGKTEIVYLAVANLGSLALKYNVLLDIEDKGLIGSLEYAVLDYEKTSADAQPAADWAALSTLAGVNTGDLVAGDMDILPADTLAKGETDYFALAVHMKEDAGNEYQGDEIVIDIKLVATQLTAENDSFNNLYDAAAPWIGTIPASLDETTLEIVPGGGSQTGTITVNTPEDLVYLNKLAAEWVSLYSNGQGTNVGSYRENVGGKGTDYYYHWAWDIKLATNLDMSNIPMDSVDISYWNDFDGNGHTISNVVLKDGQDGLFINGAKAVNNLTVKNIKVNAPKENTVGAVSGNGAMTNVHVENAVVVGAKYVGGLCGKGSSFVNCSIKNASVSGSDKTVGGLVGYSIGDPNAATVTGNLVENVTVTGAYNVGGLLGQAQNEIVENNTVKDVKLTSNASVASNDITEKRTGAVVARVYTGATIGTNEVINVTEFTPATPETIKAEIEAAAVGTTIYLAPTAFHETINMKSGITLVGTVGTVVDCINLNGADDIALKNITFDAAGAKMAYDGKGNPRDIANIMSGNASKNGKGTRNLLIEGCVFTGEFAVGGVTIAFNDQGRGSGQSGNITIRNCTFEAKNRGYDIYTYYSGYGEFVIEGNTFASVATKEVPAEYLYNIYLGRYQSSTPVVVKGNNFKTYASLDKAAYIQAHSTAYTVSFDASNNTFAN